LYSPTSGASGSCPFISRSTRFIPRRASSLAGAKPSAVWYWPNASASALDVASTEPRRQCSAT
jgi:hypothetical protein